MHDHIHSDDRCCRKFQSTFDANAERLSVRVTGTWNAGYDVTGTWNAGYDVAGVPAASDELLIVIYFGDFDKYAHMLYVFINKHTCIIYFS
jgi:hypothetical protein